MSDLHKNPALYYILIPVLAAVWPLLLWARSLPAAEKDLAKWKGYVPDVNAVATEILRLDPDRIGTAPKATEPFDYMTAVNRAAVKCGITSNNYGHSTGVKTKSSTGEESQTATVTLSDVTIVQACQFLSVLEMSWPHLDCTGVDLTQAKKVLDRWEAKLQFKYFYN
jgi:hypothetical protein